PERLYHRITGAHKRPRVTCNSYVNLSPLNGYVNLSPGEPECDHVPILDLVILPLQADRPVLTGRGDRAARHEVRIRHYLGADEPALHVGVDAPRGLGSPRAGPDRP